MHQINYTFYARTPIQTRRIHIHTHTHTHSIKRFGCTIFIRMLTYSIYTFQLSDSRMNNGIVWRIFSHSHVVWARACVFTLYRRPPLMRPRSRSALSAADAAGAALLGVLHRVRALWLAGKTNVRRYFLYTYTYV